jgi:hypothetical protein
MNNTKYIGMDVHRESISIAVLNSAGKIVLECVVEAKASTILQFIGGLRGESTRRVIDGIWTSRYVAHSSDAHALYPVLVHRLAPLLDASFRPHLAAIALASSLTLHLHQVG